MLSPKLITLSGFHCNHILKPCPLMNCHRIGFSEIYFPLYSIGDVSLTEKTIQFLSNRSKRLNVVGNCVTWSISSNSQCGEFVYLEHWFGVAAVVVDVDVVVDDDIVSCLVYLFTQFRVVILWVENAKTEYPKIPVNFSFENGTCTRFMSRWKKHICLTFASIMEVYQQFLQALRYVCSVFGLSH